MNIGSRIWNLEINWKSVLNVKKGIIVFNKGMAVGTE